MSSNLNEGLLIDFGEGEDDHQQTMTSQEEASDPQQGCVCDMDVEKCRQAMLEAAQSDIENRESRQAALCALTGGQECYYPTHQDCLAQHSPSANNMKDQTPQTFEEYLSNMHQAAGHAGAMGQSVTGEEHISQAPTVIASMNEEKQALVKEEHQSYGHRVSEYTNTIAKTGERLGERTDYPIHVTKGFEQEDEIGTTTRPLLQASDVAHKSETSSSSSPHLFKSTPPLRSRSNAIAKKVVNSFRKLSPTGCHANCSSSSDEESYTEKEVLSPIDHKALSALPPHLQEGFITMYAQKKNELEMKQQQKSAMKQHSSTHLSPAQAASDHTVQPSTPKVKFDETTINPNEAAKAMRTNIRNSFANQPRTPLNFSSPSRGRRYDFDNQEGDVTSTFPRNTPEEDFQGLRFNEDNNNNKNEDPFAKWQKVPSVESIRPALNTSSRHRRTGATTITEQDRMLLSPAFTGLSSHGVSTSAGTAIPYPNPRGFPFGRTSAIPGNNNDDVFSSNDNYSPRTPGKAPIRNKNSSDSDSDGNSEWMDIKNDSDDEFQEGEDVTVEVSRNRANIAASPSEMYYPQSPREDSLSHAAGNYGVNRFQGRRAGTSYPSISANVTTHASPIHRVAMRHDIAAPMAELYEFVPHPIADGTNARHQAYELRPRMVSNPADASTETVATNNPYATRVGNVGSGSQGYQPGRGDPANTTNITSGASPAQQSSGVRSDFLPDAAYFERQKDGAIQRAEYYSAMAPEEMREMMEKNAASQRALLAEKPEYAGLAQAEATEHASLGTNPHALHPQKLADLHYAVAKRFLRETNGNVNTYMVETIKRNHAEAVAQGCHWPNDAEVNELLAAAGASSPELPPLNEVAGEEPKGKASPMASLTKGAAASRKWVVGMFAGRRRGMKLGRARPESWASTRPGAARKFHPSFRGAVEEEEGEKEEDPRTVRGILEAY